MARKAIADDFWAHVDVRGPDECWLWKRSKSYNGSGFLRAKGRCMHAHRYAYTISKGPVPRDLEVCHACDQRACCNPAHLWLGTHTENMQDASRKGRTRTPKNRGADNPMTSFTEKDVRTMRQMRRDGATVTAIAARYRITKAGASNIIRGKRWPHIKD